MTHCDLLVPFALPPAALAPDLLRQLQAPALAMLTSRASRRQHQVQEDFSRTLPHESWLAQRCGVARPESSPALAALAMQGCGLARPEGFWFMLQPVHLHIARDHLVLTDQRRLTLTRQEAQTLFDSAQELCAESGHELLYGGPYCWFLRADAWHALQTATRDAACGRNIDLWMPQGSHARDWRKLHNLIQMTWHTLPLNDLRQERGQLPVNALWLSCGTPAGQDTAGDAQAGAALAQLALAHPDQDQTAPASLDARLSQPDAGALVLLDHLLEPALNEDWADWLARLQALEQHWFAPLLQALRSKRLNTLNLILCHGTHLLEYRLGKRALAKFWIQPSLNSLLP